MAHLFPEPGRHDGRSPAIGRCAPLTTRPSALHIDIEEPPRYVMMSPRVRSRGTGCRVPLGPQPDRRTGHGSCLCETDERSVNAQLTNAHTS